MLLTIVMVFIVCFWLERILPGWPLPRVKTWPIRVLLVNAVQLGVVLLAGVSWERWLSSWSLFDLSAVTDPWLGGFLAYFIALGFAYFLHDDLFSGLGGDTIKAR